MPSINLRQLRDTRQLKAWLRAGQTVELRERNRALGHIVPTTAAKPAAPLPDFAARTKRIFGRRKLPSSKLLIRERERVARQHGSSMPIRTLDSLHVASALELGADRFWTLDRRQGELARAAGLETGT